LIDNQDIKQVLDRMLCPQIREEAKDHIFNCPYCRRRIQKTIEPYGFWISLFKKRKPRH